MEAVGEMSEHYCFATAAIVKGIIENKDKSRHFGSTASVNYWAMIAIDAGLIDQKFRVTKKGREWYRQLEMNKLKDGRAYFWKKDSWVFR
jgi:hypothetical protein